LVVIFWGEVGCQNILKLKLQAKLWWEFARSLRTLWFEKKDPCLCQGWRIQSKYNDSYVMDAKDINYLLEWCHLK
jgi:hypothetical protein